MSEKYDSFQPRRAASLDGFLSSAGQRPRQPKFRTPKQQTMDSAPTQARSVGFADAPRYVSTDVRSKTVRRADSRDMLPQPNIPEFADAPRTVSSTPGLAADLSPRQMRKAERAQRKAMKRAAKQNRKVKGGKIKRVLKMLGVLFFVGIAVLIGLFYKDIAKLTGNNNPFGLLGVFQPVELQSDNGRVNVLVAGNSADDLGHDGGELTDSIMLLSLNTKNNTALMLSIPRDLWVERSDGSHSKINAVYPDEGMSGLRSVVEDVTGLPVHYEALVNYTAFKDLVDAVGGITITIDSDDPRGIYDSSLDYTSQTCCALAKYPNGPANLDGKQALNLARARGDGYGSYGFPGTDFTRTENQRKMILAIKDKATSSSVLSNPLKITSLLDAVGDNVRTDIQVNEMQSMYYYVKNIGNDKIDSYNINNLRGENTTMLQNYTAPGNQSALIPAAGIDDYSDIRLQIQKIFTAGPLVKENAGVVVLNATEATGIAKQQRSKLTSQGADVLSVGDATANQSQTTIIDNSGGQKPNTLAYLKTTYKATVVSDPTVLANYPNADFILLLGESAIPKPEANSEE